MSLKPMPIPPVPEEIARVARAAFPKRSVVMQLRDELGGLSTDNPFADLFPTYGQPAEVPWGLAPFFRLPGRVVWGTDRVTVELRPESVVASRAIWRNCASA